MNTTKPRPASSTVHWLLTIAGTAGIVALFLPFAYEVSPLDAALDEDLREELWPLATPFFLAVLASAACARWIVSGALSAAERTISYVVSVSLASVTLWIILIEIAKDGSLDARGWLIVLIPLAVLASGVVALIRNSRIGIRAEFNPVMAIQVAYLFHAMLCLVWFHEYWNWNLGVWFVLTAVLAYTLQIILVSMHTVNPSQDHPS